MSKNSGMNWDGSGFSEEALHESSRVPGIVREFEKIAKEYYKHQWRIALRCIQIGFSMAMMLADREEERKNGKR